MTVSWTSNRNWPCSRTLRSTTPRARAAAETYAAPGKGMGSTTGMGICHSYTPDGRCVSLLKILLTNFCLYDCVYCVNRRSSDVPRARFSVREVVDLTLSFYRRNYIEGLFLSSGIIAVGRLHHGATGRCSAVAARGARVSRLHPSEDDSGGEPCADRDGGAIRRLSRVNIELPSREALTALAPEKTDTSIKRAMGEIRLKLEEKADGGAKAPKFSPAGQSTADHRRRGFQQRRVDPGHGGHAVPLVSVEACVLLGIQPDSTFVGAVAESRAAVDARASVVSGGLAASLLRLLHAGVDRLNASGPARFVA